MTDGRHPVTEALIEFALGLDPKRLPEPVVEAATASVLDWKGTAIRGSREPLAEALDRVVSAAGGAPQATVLGRGKKTSALWASLNNGAQSHALDFDDTHVAGLIHGSAPVAPVVLALAEWLGRSGIDALAAFVAGFEVEARIGRAIGHALAERGWRVTATLGTFGAAVAAGKLLGLDASTLTHAMGIAGSQAAGLEQSFGTMSKPFHQGKAAMNGLLAALLAREGFTGPTEILEGSGSFPQTFLGSADLSPALAGLGERFEVLDKLAWSLLVLKGWLSPKPAEDLVSKGRAGLCRADRGARSPLELSLVRVQLPALCRSRIPVMSARGAATTRGRQRAWGARTPW
jgi:2-methylcitrate dehydratase PrpD